MTDRELLELAANAIGETVVCSEADYHGCTDASTIYRGVMLAGRHDAWGPLHDDGDALRLAVALRISIAFVGRALIQVSADGRPIVSEYINLGADPNEATRRAIVQAASAMASAKTPNV